MPLFTSWPYLKEQFVKNVFKTGVTGFMADATHISE